MKAEHAQLLERLARYELDDPNSDLPFSARLARDLGWSRRYTERAIAEYKRFAFLAVAAGHPVSPSDAVDQVWHEHLIYTCEYWKKFCGEVLQTPLHHSPSKGGTAETLKFGQWYANTLASYELFFGHPAPGDIWPDPMTRAGEVHRRINLADYWLVPKVGWSFWAGTIQRARTSVTTAFSALGITGLLAGCTSIATHASSPLDLSGKAFLVVFISLGVIAFAFGMALRRGYRKPSGRPDVPVLDMDPYAVAFLGGGPVLALNAAITALVQRRVLEPHEKDAEIKVISRELDQDAHLMEKAIFEKVSDSGSIKIKELRPEMEPLLHIIRTRLIDLNLVMTPVNKAKASLVPLIPIGLLLVFGAWKIMLGLERGEPVGWLTALCLALLFGGLVATASVPHRTGRGDQMLKGLRTRHSHLARSWSVQPPEQVAALLPLVVGLFGLSALAGTPLADLQTKLTPARCSGGCGGGAACGGGGCGAGGCGGGCGGG